MKTLFSLSILFFSILSTAQTTVLKDHDFSKGGFYLLGVSSPADENALADSLGDFYTNDIELLNEIKKDWIFKKPSPQYACGYHYIVYICKDGLEIENLAINLNCNEIATDKGYFYFDTEKLARFSKRFKKPVFELKTFENITEARAAHSNTAKESNVITVNRPLWLKYEGKFSFIYPCDTKNGTCFDQEKEIHKKLTREFLNTFPNEPFELSDAGGSTNELFIEVRCNQSFSDKFNLYKRGPIFDKWESYPLKFECFRSK